ncbi:glycosyltransferase family 4 protein [Pedobacter metabolipauper]|uniref:Glycosyltransferase involved in cell wall biosynthesis n=1 Tax=Pedobacter metabolipauper TaxID=425513 RepID=A0A4R6SZ14_9SPHI|nr:glycosyltransferase family 4 protein [Pedobacter metabolipauper]TDQ09934.1 glycosyltransferase involved in cell wall biosynthesis [Pedobacter metabolipauper]
MKIFQLIQKPQLRGAEMFASQLSANLELTGDEVCLISLFPGMAKLPFEGEKIELNRPIGKRFFDLKGWKQLAALIKEKQPQVIQANAADTLKFAVFSKLIFGWNTPIIYRNANKMGDFIKSKFQMFLNRFLVSQTAFVISVSHECEIDFINTFQFPVQKIATVQVGVEPQKPGSIPDDLTGIRSHYPILVNVAGFVPEKNHAGLVRIFSNLIKKFPDAQLILIGEGRLEAEIKSIIEKEGFKDHVKFLGRRTDVLEIIKLADVFVLPSLIEGLPAVLLESMYHKTPVVAYHVGGIAEIVKAGKTGWLIEKNDEKNFVAAVNEVLEKKEYTDHITGNAFQMVSEEFMNVGIAGRFRDIYKNFNNE